MSSIFSWHEYVLICLQAVKAGNKHVIRVLLEHGANFAAQAEDNTAIMKYAKPLPNYVDISDCLNSHIKK